MTVGLFGSIGAELATYLVSGFSSTGIVGILLMLISMGEGIIFLRNTWVPDEYWQFIGYHAHPWEAKIIRVNNINTGYVDIIEVPYKDGGWELDRDNAIYIDMATGKRNMTRAETYKYF